MVAACVVGRWLCAAVLMGLAVGCVSNLGNFMLKLIQKNINKFCDDKYVHVCDFTTTQISSK